MTSSGRAGIAYWINGNYKLKGSEMIGKKDPLVDKLLAWIEDEYSGGRQTTLSPHELEEKIFEYSGGKLKGDTL